MKGPSSFSVGASSNNNAVHRSNTQNRFGSEVTQSQNVMMNNFAGPSDTQNFAHASNGYVDGEDDNGDVRYMGNHVVKTVRNLRMR